MSELEIYNRLCDIYDKYSLSHLKIMDEIIEAKRFAEVTNIFGEMCDIIRNENTDICNLIVDIEHNFEMLADDLLKECNNEL